MASKNLITFQLRDGAKIYLRSVLWPSEIRQEDAEFYYHSLLGFQSYSVKVQCRTVPTSFTLSLLGANTGDIPIHFPAHDYQTTEEGLTKYYQLIQRVCDMAHAQEECACSRIKGFDLNGVASAFFSFL